MSSGTTGKIFINAPGPYICLTNCTSVFEVTYVDDPNNPLTNITLSEVGSPSPVSASAATRGRQSIALKKMQGAAASPIPGGSTCTFSAGVAKCSYLPDGVNCVVATGTFGPYMVSSAPTCFLNIADPWIAPHHDPKNGSDGGTGCPIDVATGKLWYTAHDGKLSGPFGLNLSHRYDTENAATQYDMGYGWHHSYDDYLDISNIKNPNNPGQVIYRSNSCARDFFNVQFGVLYDPSSGDTLTVNSSSYTLTTWDNRILQFDSAGRLMSLSDRVGNQQTILRDSLHRITSVVDALGRALQYTYDGKNRILTIKSAPAAISVTFAYDSGAGCYTGDLCSAIESDGSKWVYQYYNPSAYGGNHLLLSVTDPLGHTEESNSFTSQNDTFTNINHYFVQTQTFNNGKNTLSFAYSPGDTEVTDADGNTTSYYWDPNSLVVTDVTGPLCNCAGSSRGFIYDDFNKLEQIQDDINDLVDFAYAGDIIATSPDGTSSYIEQSYPKPTSYTQYGFQVLTGPSTRQTNLNYFPLGDPRQDLPQTVTQPSVDTAGQTISTGFGFTTQGLLTKLTRSGYVNGTATTRSASATYDLRGRLLTETGPRTDVSQLTTRTYFPDTDGDLSRRGQLQTITDALKHVVSFGNAASPYNTYSAYGGPASTTDANGVITDFTYDARGRTLSRRIKGVPNDIADLSTTITYDGEGKQTGLTEPLGNALRFGYDANDNLTGITRLDATSVQREQAVYAYDAGSRNTSMTLQTCAIPTSSCSTWSTTYLKTSSFSTLDQDSYDAFPGVSGDLGLSYGYAAAGELTRASYGQSPSSNGDSYERDYTYGQNRELTSVSDNALSALSLNYDLEMNVVGVTPFGLPITTATFDDFGELKTQVSPYTGTTVASYDSGGNILSRTDGNGAVTTYKYDALNRRTSAISTRSGKTTESCAWTYDSPTAGAFGIGRAATMTDPSGSTTYTYERRGLLASTVQKVGITSYATAYTYDGNGNRISATLPSMRLLTYAFDFADRPVAVKSGTAVYVSAARYEPFGPLAQVTFGNGVSQAWSFNQRYKPVENKVTFSAVTLFDQTYTQEASGLTSSTTDKLKPANSRRYAYFTNLSLPPTNQLSTVATTANASWASFKSDFDQNLYVLNGTDVSGNATAIGLGLDSADRITNVQTTNAAGVQSTQTVTEDKAGNETAVGTAEYSYSSRNLLVSGDSIAYSYDGYGRRVSATSSLGTRTALYDQKMHLQSESSLTSSAIGYDYIWLGDLPVAQEDVTGQTHWTVTDDLHAPILQTTSAGATYWQAVYAPYGAIYGLSTPDVHQPLRRPGQEAEEFAVGNPNGATTRFYNGFRWYRPLFGRYTQADPLGYGGGQFNLYSYAENDPLNEVDPLGLDPVGIAVGSAVGGTIGWAVGGAAGVGLGAAVGTLVEPGGATVAGAAFGGDLGSAGGATIGIALGTAIGDWTGNALGDLGNYLDENDESPEITQLPGFKKPGFDGPPGSTHVGEKQTRTYGPDGYPETDVDTGHTHGQGDPHTHRWTRPPDGSPPVDENRQPGEPWKNGDPPLPRGCRNS